MLCLWNEEDQIRLWAIEKIAEHKYLPDHLELTETYMDCVDMVRKLDLSPKRRNALASLYLRTLDLFCGKRFLADIEDAQCICETNSKLTS